MSFPVPGFLQQNAPDRSTRTTRRVIFYAPQNRMPSPAESRIIPMGDGALPFFRRQRACSPHSSRNTTMERRSGAMPALSAANPASVESAMLTAVARIIATTQGRTPPRTALTPAYFIRFCSTDHEEIPEKFYIDHGFFSPFRSCCTAYTSSPAAPLNRM